MAGEDLFAIARQAMNSALHNVLNSRVVTVRFHRSPGDDNGGDRAIAAIRWQVRAQGLVIQQGVTGADGRIDMTVRGAASTLELLHAGAPVARYEVRRGPAALAAANTTLGQQQRLRLLGYQIGHAGQQGTGTDGSANHTEFERSVLDHQAEHGRTTDATVSAAVQTDLRNDAGA